MPFSDFLRDAELFGGEGSRSAGRGDNNGGSFNGVSDDKGFEGRLFVLSGFVVGVAFFDCGEDRAGVCSGSRCDLAGDDLISASDLRPAVFEEDEECSER